jgi:hypothetical protein
MTERKFEGMKILSENPGRCPDCRASVETLLVQEASGHKTWLKCDQLITGPVRHQCGNAPTRKVA